MRKKKSPVSTFNLVSVSGLNSPDRRIKRTPSSPIITTKSITNESFNYKKEANKYSIGIFTENVCVGGKKINTQEAQIVSHRLEMNKLTANKDFTGNAEKYVSLSHTHTEAKRDENVIVLVLVFSLSFKHAPDSDSALL